jgi:hypothetical protein
VSEGVPALVGRVEWWLSSLQRLRARLFGVPYKYGQSVHAVAVATSQLAGRNGMWLRSTASFGCHHVFSWGRIKKKVVVMTCCVKS